MKYFFRRANRGLLLGLVLLIGLMAFIVVDEGRFEGQKQQIENTLEQYLQDISELSTSPSEYQTIGKAFSEPAVQDKQKQKDAIKEQYYCNTSSMELIVSDWEEILQYNAKGNGYIKRWEASIIGRPIIRKEGTGQALVALNYRLSVDFVGLVYANDIFHAWDLTRDLQKDENGALVNPTQEYHMSMENASANFLMEQIDGKWKIKKYRSGAGDYQVR